MPIPPRSSRRLYSLALVALLALMPRSALGAARPEATLAVTPGMIDIVASPVSLGVVWWIEGDDNHDSTMTCHAAGPGQVGTMPGMRAWPELRTGDTPLNENRWATSILWLEPGTTYELTLMLSEPGSADIVRSVTATTTNWPEPDPTGRQLFVAPGSSGGSGTLFDPLLGLQGAADIAQPGDTFLLTAGTYAPFQITTSGTAEHPISFIGPDDGGAILDGGDTGRGIVTLGEYNQPAGHIILQDLTIQNGAWGIDAQRTHDILVKRCTIQDVNWGITNRRDHGDEARQMVLDCAISGRTAWPGSGIPGERGIDLRGEGNLVAHCRVDHFGDGISLQPFTSAAYGNDVYGNDVFCCVDDGIEVDYNRANVRVWGNRVTNCRMGVSLQPIHGGPAYVLRNEMFNIESEPVKMHNYTAGFYILHNTGVKIGNGYGDNGAMWRNAILRNNLFLGTRYAFEFTTTPDVGLRDFDYDAWGTYRTDPPWFKWNNTRYDDLADLYANTDQEEHGVEADYADLVEATLPTSWDTYVAPDSYDLNLIAGAPEIDSGVVMGQANDPYVVDGSPDMGARELGMPAPVYGPRETNVASERVCLPLIVAP